MQDVLYAYYPAFLRLAPPDDPESAAAEVQRLFDKYAGRVQVRGVYSGVGFRPDVDLFMWWVASEPDALQDLLVEFRRTELGEDLELSHAFLGVVRPAEFNPDHRPAFVKGEPPKRYLSVYPFVRTEDWYLLPPEERGRLLAEHGRMGREFDDILPNTTSAFGIGDWEWILAFEADRLERITDCIRRLREAEARRYTKLDVPFVVGIRKDLADAVRDLG
jgi:chlorite dismutase